MHVSIKLAFSNTVLFEGEYTSTKTALEAAVKDGANLRGADLRGADLRGANLRGADLYGANLYGADLYGANLRRANLRGADLYGANLYGANLYGADLYGANLRGANLYGADLRGADLRGANLYGANLYGANLYGEKLHLEPVQVLGLPNWHVIIAGTYMQIGCEKHKIEEWAKFKPSRIKLMDDSAAIWWKTYKPILIPLAQQHLADHLATDRKKAA